MRAVWSGVNRAKCPDLHLIPDTSGLHHASGQAFEGDRLCARLFAS